MAGTVHEFSTAGSVVETIQFKLDGVLLTAYKPKGSLLMQMLDLLDDAAGVDDLPEAEQQQVGASMAQVMLGILPKVFDGDSRDHLEGRFYDPSDPFDVMPSLNPDGSTKTIGLFTIVGWLMDTLTAKKEEPKTTSRSVGGSKRPVRASTVTARSKAGASTGARSRTKG